MIKMTIKFCISFIISFVILTIPINSKTLFHHITDVTGYTGKNIADGVTSIATIGFETTKKLGKELFSNSNPKINDHVKQRQSSTHRRKTLMEKDKFIREEISREDKKKLNQIVK